MTPTAIYILVLFIGTGGLSIGGYKTYDACEAAGFAATKAKTVEFICVPAEIRLDLPPPKKAVKATPKGKKK